MMRQNFFKNCNPTVDENIIIALYLLFPFFMCMMFCLHERLCDMSMQFPEEPEEGVRTPGTGVADGCECCVGAGN